MLASSTLTVLVGTTKPEIAKTFYGGTLGLKRVSEDAFATVFASKNANIRVSTTPAVVPAPYAVMAFDVADLNATMDAFMAKGVVFARFGFLVQDARGVWTAPDGMKIAWFHDPDMNMLSIVQNP